MYKMLKLTCYIPSLRRTMRCSLWRSTFFLTVRTSGYRKTDCIRVNCDVYGNISGIEEERPPHSFQEFQTCRDMFYRVFLHIFFCHKHIRTFIRTFIHTYIRTYIHKYIRTYVYTYTFIHTFIHIRLYEYMY